MLKRVPVVTVVVIGSPVCQRSFIDLAGGTAFCDG
jgi:hypothetical protein